MATGAVMMRNHLTNSHCHSEDDMSHYNYFVSNDEENNSNHHRSSTFNNINPIQEQQQQEQPPPLQYPHPHHHGSSFSSLSSSSLSSSSSSSSSSGSSNGTNINKARQMADRLFTWSTLAGLILGISQFTLSPMLVPVFSTVPEVKQAAKLPSLIASLIHVINGPVLAGEGIMIGLGCYRDLAIITSTWIATMIACLLSPMGKRLDGIMWSILLSSMVQQVGVIWYYLRKSPLAITVPSKRKYKGKRKEQHQQQQQQQQQ